MPSPTIQPPVPVVLGGIVTETVTDGRLVTAIMDPSYQIREQLARYPEAEITHDGAPRIPDYDDRMTVRQLTDIVAFLQSRYTVQRPLPEYYH